jgi:cell division protease FtsH
LQFTRRAKKLAKQYGACVAYIDEIDAIGTSRGAVQTNDRRSEPETATEKIKRVVMGGGMGMGMGGMALSTLLSQIDGMGELTRAEKLQRRFWRMFGRDWKPNRNWHVMWMGSTNRPDVLDPALVRSGRLDTHIAVMAPDRASRRLIIQGYLSKIQYDETVDIESIVQDTVALTPADIMTAITKNAVRIAFFDGRKKVSQQDIDRAFLELMHGSEMPIEEFEENQRRVLAYHEAGHAVAQYYMMPDQKIVRMTIVRLSTGEFGHMAPADTVEQHIKPIMHYAYDIIVCLAGRAAEKIYSGEAYDSVGGDYPFAIRLMRRLAFNGFFGPPTVIEGVAEDMMKNKLLQGYWLKIEEATEKLLRRHWREVMALAEAALEKNTLSGKEVVNIIETNQISGVDEETIIPRTLAALRAQALADIRNANTLHQPNGSISNGANGVNGKDEVIVINGNGNGVYVPHVAPSDKPTSALPTPPAPPTMPPPATVNTDTPQNNDGPTLLNDSGSYEPKLAEDDPNRK